MKPTTRVCPSCKEEKPIALFAKCKSRKSGIDCYCKACNRIKQQNYIKSNRDRWNASQRKWQAKNRAHLNGMARDRYWANPEKERARIATTLRKLRARPGFTAGHSKRYRKRHPVEHLARRKCEYAVRTGKLPRATSLPCVKCGKQAEHYHHHKGYEEEHWYDVIAVCRLCHEALHHKGDRI